MKTKIKEVQNYFKSAILEGRYEVKDTSQYYITVMIDEQYRFFLWRANGHEFFKTYNSNDGSFMQIEFDERERKIGFETMKSKLTPAMNRKTELELERDKIDDQIKALSI